MALYRSNRVCVSSSSVVLYDGIDDSSSLEEVEAAAEAPSLGEDTGNAGAGSMGANGL